MAAPHRNGAAVIEADIRRGSRADALRFAAALGAAQRGVAEHQAMARILTRDTGPPGAHRDDGAEP